MHRRAIVIFPTGDLSAVEAFRQSCDPLAASVRAHITLAYPFDDPAPADAFAASLEPLATSVRPFAVVLRRLVVVDDQYLFLLADGGAEEIQKLHDAIYAGPLDGLPRPTDFVPHMTIGRSSDPAQIAAAARAAERASISLIGMATALSVYRISGQKRIREFDLPLG